MDIFVADKLTKIIETCLVFKQMEDAERMFPDKQLVERVVSNQHLGVGDVLPS